jgi:YjbE family integral membrane protein
MTPVNRLGEKGDGPCPKSHFLPSLTLLDAFSCAAHHPLQDISMEIFTAAGFTAFIQVIAIDLVLAGDNAIVIGLAAAGLPAHLRRKAILIGIIAATVLRIGFAAVTVQLLDIVGLRLVGGLLLAWVCWKMWVELREQNGSMEDEVTDDEADLTKGHKTFFQAAMQIVIADVSMSLDNVLAVAGAAQEHLTVLVIGLVVSIALMGLAANFVAKLLHRYRWISYLGLMVIIYVALNMLYHGGIEVWPYVQPYLGQ